MKFKQRIEDDFRLDAIGLEVHVEGWGVGPFFTVRGFDRAQGTVLLSKRYSHKIEYRVKIGRVYFTRKCMKTYQARINALKKEIK
mgnify:CR=1 FL=1